MNATISSVDVVAFLKYLIVAMKVPFQLGPAIS
jgi:hypothetical protein